MKYPLKLFTSVILLALFAASPAFAQSAAQNTQDDGEGLDYDTLIRKLSHGGEDEVTTEDPFDNVKIHAGVGFVNSIFTVNHINGDKTYGAQRGIQVSLGIDLFSKFWQAEGTFRNFGETKYENASISTKEFDLKLLYQSRFSPSWAFRMGGGLAARYMNIDYFGQEGAYSKQYQTPASLIQGGLLTYLTNNLSIGADASLRNALIDETPDRTAFDFTLRLDGHF
jgi:hypothetical protein